MAIVWDTVFGPVKLTHEGESLRADVDGDISFRGVVFGGWTASLAALAAADGLDGQVLSALHVVFTGQVRPGALLFDIEQLRAGGSMAARRVTAHQGGEPLASVQAWFTRPDLFPSATHPRATPPQRSWDDCPTIEWSWPDAPFLRHIDERAIDYPTSYATFQNGPPHVELWARPFERHLEPLPRQLLDVILFDAHLLDAAYRATTLTDLHMVSLDLCVTWATTPPDGWLHVTTDALLGPSLVVTTGTLADEHGTRYAVATSQGRSYAPR
ncbi:acyl-CoA thioesterase domain-containing protein [Acrocarpospora sp. B8E8]|uniref:acyl-CoA thioesterase n=1 Tax=Acrocarpospora sp. B8E8 TaxID=3153572 RepID=UPI00325DA238